MMISEEEHQRNLARAIQQLYNTCGRPEGWSPEIERYHDLVLARIDIQDGYPPLVNGREIDIESE